MKHIVEELARKMDALGLWDVLPPYNFAIKPRNCVFPYFCTAVADDKPMLKVRFTMMEGWQTFHDFLRTRADVNFGVCSVPMELPHFELLVLKDGRARVFRHNPGLVPREINDKEQELVGKLLWEAYGIMMRCEADHALLTKYAEEEAIFSRQEVAEDKWEDVPLKIVQPQTYTEKIAFSKADIKRAVDLPFAKDEVMAVDFRLNPQMISNDVPPRYIYELVGVDLVTRKRVIYLQASVRPGSSLKSMWEEMPAQLLKEFIRLGRVPGRLKTRSGRVFRFLRPLCLEVPLKLSLHDSVPELG